MPARRDKMWALQWEDLGENWTMLCTTQGEGSPSAVLLLLGAPERVDAKKKGGGARKEAGVSRSRNYAFGKPGSMEPDSS
jgi:hypothetical protein